MIDKLKLIYSSAIASVFSVAFVTVITIWAELSKPLKGWLKSVLGHHWVAKGVFSLVVYFIIGALVYFLVKKVDSKKVNKSIVILIWSTVLGMLLIFGFYWLHYLGIL